MISNSDLGRHDRIMGVIERIARNINGESIAIVVAQTDGLILAYKASNSDLAEKIGAIGASMMEVAGRYSESLDIGQPKSGIMSTEKAIMLTETKDDIVIAVAFANRPGSPNMGMVRVELRDAMNRITEIFQ